MEEMAFHILNNACRATKIDTRQAFEHLLIHVHYVLPVQGKGHNILLEDMGFF